MTAFGKCAAGGDGGASGIGRALARDVAARGCDGPLQPRCEAGPCLRCCRARQSGRKVKASRQMSASARAIAFCTRPAMPRSTPQHSHQQCRRSPAGQSPRPTKAQFDWLMKNQYYGGRYGTRVFSTNLSSGPAADIVNISSIFASFAPTGQKPIARAFEVAVRGLSEALRHELKLDLRR